MSDQYKLQRFVEAQDAVYENVVDELGAGRKETHWMWFVFPQMAGLGRSATAQRYAIASLDEARAFLAHPLLGARLRQCAALAAKVEGRSAREIFGDPDDMKFHSSMTLFAAAEPGEPVFRECLGKYFGGVPDAATLALLS